MFVPTVGVCVSVLTTGGVGVLPTAALCPQWVEAVPLTAAGPPRTLMRGTVVKVGLINPLNREDIGQFNTSIYRFIFVLFCNARPKDNCLAGSYGYLIKIIIVSCFCVHLY